MVIALVVGTAVCWSSGGSFVIVRYICDDKNYHWTRAKTDIMTHDDGTFASEDDSTTTGVRPSIAP